jgi:hypothetical protein
LKRRIAHGVAVPTKLGLTDVLLAWKMANDEKMSNDADEDAMNVAQALTAQIVSKWNVRKDDITNKPTAPSGCLLT